MRVLFLHNIFMQNDGSSLPLKGYIKDNTAITYHKVLTVITDEEEKEINVQKVSRYEDVYKEIESGNYDVIHNFRLMGYALFRWTLKALKQQKKKIKIITTINQRPSCTFALISPLELKYSDRIIFIDSTAYRDSLLKFIPENRKGMIYYVTSNLENLDSLYIERTLNKRNRTEKVVFGRGSQLVKCPSDMIDLYNKIDYPDKEFRIYGVPDDSWVAKVAANQPDIHCFPMLPNKEWKKRISEVDIFLYQIPTNSFSSLDGVLSTAMRLAIPVVYYGAEAPKERFIHGKNGFVANTKEEFVEYATLLAKDYELRKQIGEEGRKTQLEKFSWQNTVDKYNQYYNENLFQEHIKVPISYKIFYLRKSVMRRILHKAYYLVNRLFKYFD